MAMLSKVVLLGAAGTVGSHILRALLEDPQFTITIPIRLESSSTFSTHDRVTVIRSDYTAASLVSLFGGHDAIVSATGVTTFAQQLEWIQAAHDAGVPRFVLNDYGNSIENQAGLPELEQFRTLKREGLALAKKFASDTNSRSQTESGFSWSALATGNFIDYSLKKYPAFGFDIPRRTARLVDDGREHFSAVTLADIGRAVRGILRRPEETRNKYLHIRSVETCQIDILNALEARTKEKWDVRWEDSGVVYERGKQAFASGERSGMLDILVTQLFQKGGNRSIVVNREKSDNVLLGVQEKEVDTIVEDALATFEQV